MKVHVEHGVDAEDVKDLVDRLCSESFAEGCFIALIQPIGVGAERQYYVRAAKARHGVLVSASGMTPEVIDWAVNALRASIAFAGSPPP
jgi:hypothetical protein